MALNFPVRKSDLTGSTRLITDATTGITDLVEAMHERIARPLGMPRLAAEGRTIGITGLVYGSIRGITRMVGLGVEALVELIVPPLGSDAPVPSREAALAALNGVLGDHLVASGNPLAKSMALRRDGRPLPTTREDLAAAIPDAGRGILLLVHGLCMNDLQWSRAGRDQGADLARDLGLTPLWLDYNAGLHIATNGRDLAARLEALVDIWPCRPERIVLVGHSMGGLVARSAHVQGREAGHRWPDLVTDMVFLGSPHHGAPLEKAGSWIDVVLGATPYAAPFARLGRVRSAGITDLRDGRLVDDERGEGDRSARGGTSGRHVPLPADVRCWAIAATTGFADGGPAGNLLGDGLVPLDSALGRHRDPARCLAFPAERQWIARGIGHLDLLWDDDVWARLRAWLGAPAAAGGAAARGEAEISSPA